MMNKANHEQKIGEIIENHFREAEERIDEVYKKYFTDTGVILKRYWRHKKDIPSDIAAPVRQGANFILKAVSKKELKKLPKSGKVREVEKILSENLLDLKGLEIKIHDYTKPFQLDFEKEFEHILKKIPGLQRENFKNLLEQQLENFITPMEGLRELIMFTAFGIAGKMFTNKVTMGSGWATGQAISTGVYMSKLSWFGSMWASIFGTPAWISIAGGGIGIFAGAAAAIIITPFLEIGFNRLTARKMLANTVELARRKLGKKSPDAVNTAGKIALYLQSIPEIIHLSRKIARQLG